MTKRSVLAVAVLLGMSLAGSTALSAAPGKPTSVIHVITIQWKDDAAEADIKKAIDAAANINFAGLKNVWTRPIKMQLGEGKRHIIVMEFESEAALQKYAGSEAQQAWYKVYQPVRASSATHDITN